MVIEPDQSRRTSNAMPLHLIKLCVGCDSVQDLKDWIKQKLKEKRKRGEKPEHIHTTRMVPKRADELTDGGSLFWVIRGEIMCRQRIRDVRPFVDKDGIGRCGMVLEPKLVLVEPRPYRAFQGWRYLAVKDAPPRPRQARPGRGRHAGNAAARTARTRPDVEADLWARPMASLRLRHCRMAACRRSAFPSDEYCQ